MTEPMAILYLTFNLGGSSWKHLSLSVPSTPFYPWHLELSVPTHWKGRFHRSTSIRGIQGSFIKCSMRSGSSSSECWWGMSRRHRCFPGQAGWCFKERFFSLEVFMYWASQEWRSLGRSPRLEESASSSPGYSWSYSQRKRYK